MIITKELIEAVKGYTIDEILPHTDFYKKDSYLQVKYNSEKEFGTDIISINDFFFECKTWAANKLFSITSTTQTNWGTTGNFIKGKSEIRVKNLFGEAFIDLDLYLDEYGRPYQRATFIHKRFKAKTEQQAVFNACQWILDKGTP